MTAPLLRLTLAAEGGNAGLFLGRDFFPWMMIALGAALVVGNVVALVRPPAPPSGAATGGPGRHPRQKAPTPKRPSITRAGVMIALGLVIVVWGVASLGG